MRTVASFNIILMCLLISYQSSARLKIQKNHISHVKTCSVCGITFKTPDEYQRHIDGKKHSEILNKSVSSEDIWSEFNLSPKKWVKDCSIADVLPLWKDSELSVTSKLQLKYRDSCLHPSVMMYDLNPYQRARIWRYIRDAFGLSNYSELATILTSAFTVSSSDSNSQFNESLYDRRFDIRVKELFESIESCRLIISFVVAMLKSNAISQIVELAGGHGLVATLLAYRFPNLTVHSFDLFKRPIFDALSSSFELYGQRERRNGKVLYNLHFHECDNVLAAPLLAGSVMICLHGCNEANEDAIEMAVQNKAAGWLVMPCCIRSDQYLGSHCTVKLQDDARYALLCGALARHYYAQLVTAIDSRISNKCIIIAGSLNITDTIVDQVRDKFNDSTLDNSTTRRYDTRVNSIMKLILS